MQKSCISTKVSTILSSIVVLYFGVKNSCRTTCLARFCNTLFVKKNSELGLTTKKINLCKLSNDICEYQNSTKQALRRMKKRAIIKTLEYSKNRYDGYAIFKILRSFYKEYLNIIDQNNSNNIKKISPIYNNSNNYYYYNNPIKQEKITESLTKQISNPWNEIDISPLEHVGLKKDHLEKLSQIENVTPEKVQDSIYQFCMGTKKQSIQL